MEDIDISDNLTVETVEISKKKLTQPLDILDLCIQVGHDSHDVMWRIWFEHVPVKIPYSYLLNGWSKSTASTGFIIESLGMLFDCGIRPPCKINYTFLTHRHSDHSEHIRISGDPTRKQKIFVPEEDLQNVINKVKSEKQLTMGDQFDISTLDLEITGVFDGYSEDFTINDTRFTMRVFKCFHSTPCVGYGLSRYNNKLKSEFKGLDRKELADMRKRNEIITQEEEDRFFLYLGDTTHEVFSNPEVLRYRCIMVECTFIRDEELERSVITQHMHWVNL